MHADPVSPLPIYIPVLVSMTMPLVCSFFGMFTKYVLKDKQIKYVKNWWCVQYTHVSCRFAFNACGELPSKSRRLIFSDLVGTLSAR